MKPDFSEKRDFLRLAINSDFSYTLEDQDRTFTGFCNNISHTGIHFLTDQNLAQGNSLEITIETQHRKIKPMVALVEVIRVEATKDNKFQVAGKILAFK